MWANPITLWRKGILGMNCRNVSYIARYNPRERYPLVDDKLQTKMVVRKAGVTAPELLLVIRNTPMVNSKFNIKAILATQPAVL